MLNKPLEFTPADTTPVTFAAYRDEEAIIDGGSRRGLKKPNLRQVSVWKAEVAAGEWYCRRLFVNGQRRNRPKLPKRACS